MNTNAKLKTQTKREIGPLKIESNKEFHIPMQTAFNNRKVRNMIHKICHFLLTEGSAVAQW